MSIDLIINLGVALLVAANVVVFTAALFRVLFEDSV